MNVQIDFFTQEQDFLNAETAELTSEETANAADIITAQAAIDAAAAQMKVALTKQKYLKDQRALVDVFQADLTAAEPTTTPQGSAPVISGITSTEPSGTYSAGALIPIDVTFSKPISVTGSPILALNSGANVTYAPQSVGPVTVIEFDYQVAAGETTNGSPLAVTGLALNGGKIQDANVTDADLTLPATQALGEIIISG